MWDGPNLGVYMLNGMLSGKRALAKSVHKQYGQYLWFFPKHIILGILFMDRFS